VRYALSHRTSYVYGESVDLAHHLLCLTPRSGAAQTVLSCRLHATPAGRMTSGADRFGNTVTWLTIDEPHDRFTVELQAEVEVHARPAHVLAASKPWEQVRDLLVDDGFPEPVEACEFTFATAQTPLLPELRSYAARCFTAGRPVLEAARELTRQIHRDFTFDAAATLVSTPLAEVLKRRRGVCQDFAHLQIAALRTLGLAARYMSGYIQTLDKHGKPNLLGGDASHAWVSVWCPEAGWVEFDPTNDLVVDRQHVLLSWGRDYSDVSPTRGIILGGGAHTVDVAVALRAIRDAEPAAKA
jgi:transglutaminase-like putative cysteine protease